MALQNFIVELIDGLLANKELGLSEEDLRFYDKGTTAEGDSDLDGHIQWQNARYYNADSNVVRSSSLIVRVSEGDKGSEHVSFQVGSLYRIYRKDGSLKGVLAELEATLKRIKANAAKTVVLLNKFGDLEAIRERLILRPLNYDNNEQILKNGIFRRIGDMALVLYIDLGVYKQDGGGSRDFISTMVTKELFGRWDLEGEADGAEILDFALKNTMRMQPPVFVDMNTGKHIHFMGSEDEGATVDFKAVMSPSLSTEQEVNGAIAGFYPAVQEWLYQMIGNYYLSFTSIHDVRIHPAGGWAKISTMKTALADTNREMNQPQEVLTRRVYRYDGEKRELVAVL